MEDQQYWLRKALAGLIVARVYVNDTRNYISEVGLLNENSPVEINLKMIDKLIKDLEEQV